MTTPTMPTRQDRLESFVEGDLEDAVNALELVLPSDVLTFNQKVQVRQALRIVEEVHKRVSACS